MTAQAREHVDKGCPYLTFKAKKPRTPLENIVATHPSGASAPRLPVPRAREGKRGKCLGHDGPLHLLCSGVCHPIPDCPDDSQGHLGQNLSFIMGCLRRFSLIRGGISKVSWIADLCRLMGTKKLRTSPYHPQINGQCDRSTFDPVCYVGDTTSECKSDWKGSIGALFHTYNYTQNSATGFSPYFLMYGRQPCLPIDVTLGLAPNLVAMPTSTK